MSRHEQETLQCFVCVSASSTPLLVTPCGKVGGHEEDAVTPRHGQEDTWCFVSAPASMSVSVSVSSTPLLRHADIPQNRHARRLRSRADTNEHLHVITLDHVQPQGDHLDPLV